MPNVAKSKGASQQSSIIIETITAIGVVIIASWGRLLNSISAHPPSLERSGSERPPRRTSEQECQVLDINTLSTVGWLGGGPKIIANII